jgi:translation initiation factor 4B
VTDDASSRPVDVSARDKEITERVEKDREAVASKVQQHTMSRSGSKGGFERTTSKSGSPRVPPPANIRPAVSFASALATKGEEASTSAGDEVADVTEKLSETTV